MTRFITLAVALISVFAFAACLAAVQLVPLAEWTSASSRAGGPASDALAWSLDLRRLVELAVPSVFGTVEPVRTFAAPSWNRSPSRVIPSA